MIEPVDAGSETEIGRDCNKPMAVEVNVVFYGCKQGNPVMTKQAGGVIISPAAAVVAISGYRARTGCCAAKGAGGGLRQ